MNDHIPGSPLKTLTWNSEEGIVKIVFRDDTDPDDAINFLYDLINKVEEIIEDFCEI